MMRRILALIGFAVLCLTPSAQDSPPYIQFYSRLLDADYLDTGFDG